MKAIRRLARLLPLLVLAASPCEALEAFRDTFATCLAHTPNSTSEVMRAANGAVHFAFVDERTDQSLCVSTSACTWRLSGITSEQFASLVKYVNPSCTGPGWLNPKQYYNVCGATQVEALGAQLDALVTSVYGGADVCASLQLVETHSLAAPGQQLLIFPMSTNDRSCLLFTLELSRSSVGVWLAPRCPRTAAEISALSLAKAQARMAGGLGVGAIVEEGGFFVPLRHDSASGFTVASAPVVFGVLETSYTQRWLEAVVAIVQGDADLGERIDDPLTDARRDHYLGRLVRWLLAGARQVEYASFDDSVPDEVARLRKQSLRWMSSVVLHSSQGAERALLRGELARKGWKKYE